MFSENLNNESLVKIVSIVPFCVSMWNNKRCAVEPCFMRKKCPLLLKSALPAVTSWRKTKKRRREDGPPSLQLAAKKKSSRKNNYRSRYTTEDLKRAVNLVTQEAKSVAAAALACGVPRVTLLDKLNGKHKTGMVGRPCVLSKMEEKVLVEILVLPPYQAPLGRHGQRLLRQTKDI